MSSSSAEPGLEPPVDEAVAGGSEPVRRRPRLRFLVIGFAFAAVLAAVLWSVRGSDGGTSYPREGDAMPVVSLPLLEGTGRLELPLPSSPKLRGTVVSFFASWCGPCRKEMPMVVRTAKAYERGAKGEVRFVGIDGLDQPAKAKAFLAEVGWSFPVGQDTSYAVTSGTFGFQGLPETVVVDAKGVISYVKVGELSREELVKALDALPPAG